MDTTTAPAPAGDLAAERVMDLLARHVPLTLLLDLWGCPGAPGSREILEAEGEPTLAWWAA
jgi:hypothetical protein